ncbi:MAG: MFS transporter [Dehalococcoidia bacterium]|nr:MFS transporter [Dehalococcoidia bacterium]
MMVLEGVASGALFSLGSGGFMAAYAIALGADNLQVGVLAALPFVTQMLQLPAILAIERFRVRKALGIPALIASNLMWIPIGAVPFLLDTPGAFAVVAVIGLLAVRGLCAPMWVTAWTSWMRDLVPHNILGNYYGRRLAAITGATAVVGLSASFFVGWWEGASSDGNAILAYSFLLIAGSLTLGVASPWLASSAKEPLMPAAPESGQSAVATLVEPLRDKNFSHLVRFLFVWSLTSNLAIPFFAVYMLSELGLSLPVVIGFTVLSQISNVLFVRVWGPMADRVGSKTVLALSASLYLLVILGWVFATYPERHVLTVPLLVALHIFAGVGAAGVTLTISTITLRVAPEGKATPFLGVASIATNVGAGIGPIAGGMLADYFSVRALIVDFGWISPSGVLELQAVSLSGFDFLFVIAFVVGLLSLNLLVALHEEGELPRDMALSELTSGLGPMARAVSSVPGLGAVSAFSYGYLKRVPGADVAIGVAAYQLAASSQAAVTSAIRGRLLVREVAQAVRGAVDEAIDEIEDSAGHGLELARHSTRGAVQVGDEFADQIGRAVHGAVLGAVRALNERQIEPLEALRGAGYGVVQGAVEAGQDPAEAAIEAAAAAQVVADELGMAQDEAANALAKGLLEASMASGEEVHSTVRRALLPELTGSDASECSDGN